MVSTSPASSDAERNKALIAAYLAAARKTGVLLCSGCQKLGRCRMGVLKETLHPDDTYDSTVICGAENEAGPNVAHGGWTAAMLDEALGHLLLLKGLFIVTKTLTVDYLRPVPLARELTCRAWIEKHEGQVFTLAGELKLGDSVLARAAGVFIERDMSHFERFENWIAAQG